MKYLSLLAFAACSIALPAHSFAQSGATASGSATAQTAGTFSATSRLSAEFTRKIDTKDAKVGDQVSARTTAKASLADGTELPKGTVLTGTVTEVHAKSSAEKTAHLAFSFDRAVLHDGREIPMHATLTSLSAPASASAGSTDDAFAGGGPVSAGAAGGGRVAGGGGLVGGAARTTTGLAGSTAGVAGSALGGVGATAGEVAQPVASAGVDAAGSVGTGSYVSDALRVNHYAVGNLPGVVLTSQANASVSAALDANGQNISLASGTQMTLNASTIVR